MSSSPPPAARGNLTIDDLIVLNDEIAALVRAGVPLEESLGELARDLPGRLSHVAQMLAERAARGEPLLQILADQAIGLPPVYRAVVEAGARSGRLSGALEPLATALRGLAETRRNILAATVYPLAVVMVACGVFAVFAVKIAPNILAFSETFALQAQPVLHAVAACGKWAGYWGPLIPLTILVLLAAWWSRSRCAALIGAGSPGALVRCVPCAGKTLRYSRIATFAEILALLVESDVPLHEALLLAAHACADLGIVEAAEQMARAVERGEPLGGSGKSRLGGSADRRAAKSPFLQWLVAAGGAQGRGLAPALRHAAETYRRRAEYQAELLRRLLPIALTLVVGGTITLAYALLTFVPYASILRSLAEI